jgi:AraC family transcriptional regulator
MIITRTPLLRSRTGLVERVECPAPVRGLSGEKYSPDFQVAFPYRGAFMWHVGGEAVMSDPNQVLFVGGEPFRIGEMRAQGFREVIITPDPVALRDAVRDALLDAWNRLFDQRSGLLLAGRVSAVVHAVGP